MLTEVKPDGTWSVKDVDFKDCKGGMYGALCKLRDYEATGLEPDDFMGDEYKKKRLYKVHYTDSTGLHVIYCESRKNAEFTADLLREKGLDAGVNQWSWHALIEI